ncbi:MAG: DNA-formamidopyrimidine glycosylase [Vulcanibacillus sp.]
MPELPEVETVRRSLEVLIIGKTVQTIDVLYSRIIRTPLDVQEFKSLLEGQTIKAMKRKGKYLLFEFSKVTLISHLRMEGKYIYINNGIRTHDRHTHIVFNFTDNSKLIYNDVRKFGTMDVVENSKINYFSPLIKLGQEPIDLDFDKIRFSNELKQRKAPIKQVLLSQELVCGLGNIYVDDSLAMSHIHPLRKANSLTDEEINRLVASMKTILVKAIENGGSSIKSFESIYGRGSMQEHLIVYGKTGKPCIYCGTPIVKIRICGRGTHYCPSCQIIE